MNIDEFITNEFDHSKVKIEDCKIENSICFILHNILTTEEITNLVNFSEKNGYKSSSPFYPPTYRNNLRQVIDDKKLAEKLFKRVEKYLPSTIYWKNKKIVKENETDSTEWKLQGLNERFRSCKYLPNQFFRYHQDGEFWLTKEIQSKLTFMLYLNDDFEGGFTNFFESSGFDSKVTCAVKPSAGSLIIFEHTLWHEGATLLSGEKHILRSDIMYKLNNEKDKYEKLKEIQIYQSQSRDLDYSKPLIEKTLKLEGHSGYIWKIIKLKNGDLASGSRDKTIKIWDMKTGVCKKTFNHHQNSILSLIQLKNGNLLSGSRDGTICEWTDDQYIRNENLNSGNVLCLLEAPNLDFIVVAFSNHSIMVFKEGTCAGKLEGHSDWVWDLCLYDENTLVSASEDGSIKFWNLESLKLIKTIPVHKESVNKVLKLSKDIFITGSSDKSIKLWNVETDELLMTLLGHDDYVRDLEIISEDLIASGGEDGTIKIWNLKNKKCITTLKHQNYVKSIMKLPDGKIACGSYDSNIWIWDFQEY